MNNIKAMGHNIKAISNHIFFQQCNFSHCSANPATNKEISVCNEDKFVIKINYLPTQN